MPHKGEETSDLICTPQTRERAARVLCALSDQQRDHAVAARSRCSCRVCVHKRKRGSVLCVVRQAARGTRSTQGRMVGASSPIKRKEAGLPFRAIKQNYKTWSKFANPLHANFSLSPPPLPVSLSFPLSLSLFLYLSLFCKVDVKRSPCVKPAVKSESSWKLSAIFLPMLLCRLLICETN